MPKAAMIMCMVAAAASKIAARARWRSKIDTIAARIAAVARALGWRYWSVRLMPVPETGMVSKAATVATAAQWASGLVKQRRAMARQAARMARVAANCQRKIATSDGRWVRRMLAAIALS